MIPKISSADPKNRNKVLDTILVGFSADPFVRWICPEAHNYLKFKEAFDAYGGGAIETRSAYVAGRYSGTALWLPPGVDADEERFIAEIEKNVAKEKHESLFKILEELEHYHPTDSCWYLPIIAVDPSYQNKGIGSLLMKHALEIVDSEGLPAYLESSNPRNMSLYERYGFETMGRIQVGDAPPLHPMIRTAR
jgi:GNAT superfamily N-acetyltransferase